MYFFCSSISILCAVVAIAALDTKVNTFRGCYEYSSKNSLVSDYQTTDSKTLTPQTCMKTCADKGFPFVGLEKDICHCGSHSPSDLLKRSNSECNTPCPGDSSKQCGGNSKITVYESGAPIKEYLPNRIYLGCFLDDVDAYRVLKGSAVHFTNDLTHERCHKHCYSTGWRYFGLTYVKECWCGDTPPSPDRLKDESECDSLCSGNSNQTCGGSWRTAIFATGIPNHSETGRFVSCFKNVQNEIKSKYQINLANTGSNRRCLNLCYERNFKYSGLQNKSMCTCMDVTPNSYFQEDDYNCIQDPCPADSGDRCGNRNRIRIFRTRHGDVDLDTEPKLLGCYQDQEHYRALDGGKIESIDQLIPALCIDICKARGFEFAGLEGGNECYCSHTYPSNHIRVGEFDCKVPCTGSGNHNCGGVLRVAVYSTGLPRSQALVNKWYLGCYKDDDKDNRMLRGQHNEFQDNSPEICHRHCLKIGYTYFGLTYYRECFCGDEDPWADLLLSDSECNQECNGDSNQKCGGSWKLSVYRTGIYDIPQNETVILGCYKNNGNLLKDRKIELPWSNLPTRCTNICDYLEYSYAGVERGIECRCGNMAPKGLVPEPDDKLCAHNCPGFSGTKCGGSKHTKIYRTSVPESVALTVNPDPLTLRGQNCKLSETSYNGKDVCKNFSLLNDDFLILNNTIWTGTKKMALDPDYEFVTYSTSPDVLYVKNSILFIKPKIQSSEFIQGSLKIENCTGRLNTEECSKTVQSSNILPPVTSAQITTKHSVSFRFGRMEIRAKLPSGDWIVPEIWLTPRDNAYGPEYQSGQIRIAMIRGNSELTCGSEKLGSRYLQAGLYLGPRNGVRKILFTKEMPENWLSKFHDFSIVWNVDDISFYVDGELISNVLKKPTDTVRTAAKVAPNIEYLWRDGTRLAPFDKEFYLTLGVSVGGITDFPDSCTSKGGRKPWSNTSPKAMINFWQKHNQWGSTWKDEDSALQIDHIRLNAL